MPTPSFFEAITAMEGLKKRARAGWGKRGVKNAESVADHSWRAGLMAYLLAPQGYDKEKMLLMGCIHDLTEIFEEDYTPVDGITKEEKMKREKVAAEKFIQLLPHAQTKDFREIFNEYEERKTKESQFVKQVEVLEMLFQVLEYEKAGATEKNLIEFIEYEKNNRKTEWHPALKPYFEEIQKRWPRSTKEKFDASKHTYHY